MTALPTRTRALEFAPDTADLADTSARLEAGPASATIRWARETYGDDLVLAASFQDCVLIDLAVHVDPTIEVVFLDTQYHFPETLAYVESVRARLDLNLRMVSPAVAPDDLWKTDTESCCGARKVDTLRRALDGRRAWMSGLRRCDSPGRSETPVVSWDAGRGLVKVNPIATWTDADVAAYVADRGLPAHPLIAKGYPSIGCWPCTQKVDDGAHTRSGRWAGTDKTECGLHV